MVQGPCSWTEVQNRTTSCAGLWSNLISLLISVRTGSRQLMWTWLCTGVLAMSVGWPEVHPACKNLGHLSPEVSPACVVRWLDHLGTVCSRAWRAQCAIGSRFSLSRGPVRLVRLRKSNYVKIIPMHMMIRKIIPIIMCIGIIFT